MEAILVSVWIYTMCGLVLEIVFTAVGRLLDGINSPEDRKLQGVTYLWMIPVYGIFLPLVYGPLYHRLMLADVSFLVRFVIYGMVFVLVEAACGFFYDKVAHVKPWDYSHNKYKIFPEGYSRWDYLPLWGVAGLVFEFVARFLDRVSPLFS